MDHSRISCYQQCPRQYQYKYVERIIPIDSTKEQHDRKFGSGIHAAFHSLFSGDSVQGAQEAFDKEFPEELNPEDNAKTRNNAYQIIKYYSENRLKNDLNEFEILSSEKREEFEYAGDDRFVVKIDMVVKSKSYGDIYAWDNKTVGGRNAYLSTEYFSRYMIDSQITKYTSHVKSVYGECSGAYINAIGLGYRSRIYKGQPAGPWFKIQRMLFNRTSEQLEDEELETKDWIERIKKDILYPKNTNSCYFCDYRMICEAGWKLPDDLELMMVQYERKEK